MVCRVCLKSSELQLEIFDQNGLEKRIPEILQLHLWFTPSPNDSLSKVVCFPCWCKVLEFHQFYEAAKEAHTFYSNQQKMLTNTQDSTEFSNPIEIVDTVFDVKHEKNDDNDEKWLDPQANNENALYEPEVLESMAVKSENTEANNLDEISDTNKILRIKSKRTSNGNLQNENKNLTSDNSDDDDSDDKDFMDESDSQSDYEPDTTEVKKANKKQENTQNMSTTKVIKRGRPRVITKTKNSSPKKTTAMKKSTNQRKHEKRCWSSPQDDEMVRKHLPLNCEICCFHVENYQDMIKHFQEMHKNIRPYIVCCGRRLSKRQRVVQHAYRHEDPNYFQCQICKKNFSDHYVLRSHILAHHPEEDELLYQCDQCDKRFSRSYLLKLHKPVHIPVAERKFMCTKCPTPKAFASDHLLNIHDSMRHKRAANVCHVCAKTIRDNQAFEKHVRLHFEESGPRVKCPRPGCDRWLKDEDNLKQHLRRHNDEGKIITCDQCGKSVKNRRALSSHIAYAHSTALFSCEECKKTFKKAITLKEHMAQHTGETLYKCPFCPRTFNSNANMHSHKKKMHPVQWDIWRKTKKGSSQSFQNNDQFMEMVHTVKEAQISYELSSQEQQHIKHDNIMFQADDGDGIL